MTCSEDSLYLNLEMSLHFWAVKQVDPNIKLWPSLHVRDCYDSGLATRERFPLTKTYKSV